mgnify:FL=1
MQQALYRIYRPKNFDEIYGQDQIVSILRNQLENGNLSHAYLFCGPRGTGKTSTAKVFASAINGGTDIDTVELDAASNNSVDNVRDIRDNLAFAPTSGKYKIYIIDEVHMLSAAAFNALLKTLEEPPSHVIFILATTEPQKIPQTVLSRCQRFDFRKIEKDVLVQRLSDVLAQEGKDFESEALEFIALKSEGGLRDALSILDKALSYGDLTMENLLQVLGEIHSDNYLSMLKAIMAHNTRDAIMVLGSIEKSGMDPRIFALELINFMKQVILEFNDVKQDNPNVSQAAQICKDEIAANIIEDLSTTCSNMRYSPQPQVLLLADIVRITGTRYDAIGSNRDVSEDIRAEFALMNSEIRRLETLVQGLESRLSEIENNPQLPVGNIEGSVENSGRMAITSHTKGPSSTKSPSRVSAKKIERVEISDDEKAELDRVNDAIPILYEELRAVKQAQLAALIREGKPERFFDDNIFFCFEEKNIFHKNMLETQDINNSVEKILSKLLKRNIAVQYILYSELASIKSKKISDEEKLIEKLSETFPDVNIDIKP